jgi:hypothetical protein
MARIAQRCILESPNRSKAAEIVLTSEGGELLLVSLPPNSFRLIAQMAAKKLPYRRQRMHAWLADSHRRVTAEDLMAYPDGCVEEEGRRRGRIGLDH